ncbi:SNC2 [Symbiodinium pilosum]|uniref:SNC2 protein n=1 Tax=Symbiodinium pilosum TaxID=2952 RepID=A0A812TI03_SYMPI|nr:SNC2 [Symbiodinium pilosum]
MAGHPSNGDPQAIGKLRSDLDGAMGVMRDNMRTMAERDVQLHDLEGKSNTLNVASGTFSAHATRLRREQEWQRCKTRIAIVAVFVLLVWLLIFFFASGHRMTFLGISAGILAITLPLGWCCVRRWRNLEEEEGFRDVDSI